MSKAKSTSKLKLSMSLMEFHRMFPDEDAARAFFESARWPDGVVCIHCDSKDGPGWLKRWVRWQCNDCKRQFTVKIGTPMERSHIDLHRLVLGTFLMMSSSRGISSWKLAEHLGLSYKAAWHLGHRIRAMMNDFGGPLSGVVEIDETYGGASPRAKAATTVNAGAKSTQGDDDDGDNHTPPSGGGSGMDRSFGKRRARTTGRSQNHHKIGKTGRGTARPMLLVAVERGGRVMSRPLAINSRKAIAQGLEGVLDAGTVVMTDGLPAYQHLGASHAHHTVTHSARTFVRHEEGVPHPIHVNTVESWNGLLQRALVGVFHHVSPWHLTRYAQEAAFRWNVRARHVLERLRLMVRGAWGRCCPFPRLRVKRPWAHL